MFTASCTEATQTRPNLYALTEPTPEPAQIPRGAGNEEMLFKLLEYRAALQSANNDKLLIRRALSTLPECTWFRVLRNQPCDSNNDGIAD